MRVSEIEPSGKKRDRSNSFDGRSNVHRLHSPAMYHPPRRERGDDARMDSRAMRERTRKCLQGSRVLCLSMVKCSFCIHLSAAVGTQQEMQTTNADGERRSATQRGRCRVAQSLVCTTLVGSVQSHGGIRLPPTSIERNEDEKGAAINPRAMQSVRLSR